MKHRLPIAPAAFGVFLAGLMSASSAFATNISWSSTAGTTTWSTAGNWVGGVLPTDDYTTDTAVFNQTSYANQPNLTANRSIAGLVLGDGSTATAATVISGSVLRIGTGGISKQASSGSLTFSNSLRLNTGAQSWTNDSGTAITVGTVGTASTIGSATGTTAWTFAGGGSGNIAVNNLIAGTTGGITGITVNRTGSGNVTFTNANTYTGGTTVTSGTLLLNNTTGSGTGTAAISVGAAGRLGGTGGVSGAITLGAGGAITPGSSAAGTFSGSSLTWNSNGSGAGMFFELGANQAASDQLVLSGAFTKGTGSTFVFNFADLGVTPSFTYTLVTFGSTGFSVGDFGATGVAGSFGLTGGALTFTAAAIPEPSSAVALAAAAALLFAGRARRRA